MDYVYTNKILKKIGILMGKKQDLSKIDDWIREEYDRNTQRIEDNLSNDGSFDPDKINSKILYHRIQMQILEQEERQKKMDAEKQMQKKARLHQTQKWACIFTMILTTTFMVSMTSEAARAHLKNALEYFLSDETNEVHEKELAARQEIQKKIGIPVPILQYKPKGEEIFEYDIKLENNAATIKYQCENITINLYMINTDKTKPNNQSKNGKKIKNISVMSGALTIPVEEIKNQENKEPSYSAQWNYEKGYYRLIGTSNKEEFLEIVEYICF